MSDLVTKKLGYKDNFKFVIMENYTNFKGRAGRGEYWRFTALYICLSTFIQVLSALLSDFLGNCVLLVIISCKLWFVIAKHCCICTSLT